MIFIRYLLIWMLKQSYKKHISIFLSNEYFDMIEALNSSMNDKLNGKENRVYASAVIPKKTSFHWHGKRSVKHDSTISLPQHVINRGV